MKTTTRKMPKALAEQLTLPAQPLKYQLRGDGRKQPVSALSLVKPGGPSDLATNPEYLRHLGE